MATKPKTAVRKAAPAKKTAVAKSAKKGRGRFVDEAIEQEIGSGAPAKFDVRALYRATVDEVAKRQNFDSDLLEDMPPMSTGLLALDLIHGGGIRPAWYTHYGPEQSAKTTGALTIMAAAIRAAVPIIGFKDYEGSTKNSKPYVGNILRTCGVKVSIKDVFGRRDPTTGKWVVEPTVRYRSETVGEKFFDYLADLLRKLPDKKKVNNQWWLVYERTKINMAKVGQYADKAMARKYGEGLWLPAPDGGLQALILVDSYPGMNPTSNDDDDSDNSLALQARMFSKHIPRVKGRLASKMVAVIGINQLRKIPMARYGPTEDEPCGQALKFNSDSRLRWYPRVVPSAPLWCKENKEDRLEHELSVESDGTDRYRYIHVKATKNKMWTPGREGWLRIWVEDAAGEARGFDPMFDTMFYLRQTGQLVAKDRKKMLLKLKGLGESKKPLSWMDFKAWILGDKATKIEMSKKAGFKPMDLRAFCFRQMANGVGEELYVAKRNAMKKAKGEDDDADDGDSKDDE
jgi:RecA/RadA recombinase